MDDRIYLITSFKEKERVKALGARWDPGAGRWYVPPELSLASFAAWLPAGQTRREIAAVGSATLSCDATDAVQPKGIPLSHLLAGVQSLVAREYSSGVWATAEVARATLSKGHCYLELSERNEGGELVAQTRAVIWSRIAQTLLPEFKRATGADLDSGIKVMLRVKPVFNAQYGFSLEVDGIDASYTLGDLEAKKRDIRERLRLAGIFDRNRLLPPPWDFCSVLVVAPEKAAGLGDFAREATRLERHGVCQFIYVYSRFQGEGAAAEIIDAIGKGLRAWAEPALPDALVIIRGGGSVNDLAWLNDHALARCICECPVPVFTGLGHERDNTSLDEVAHRRFDTPSKVVASIEELVRARTREARTMHESIVLRARSDALSASSRTQQSRQFVEQAAHSNIGQSRSNFESLLNAVRYRSLSTLHESDVRSRLAYDAVRFQFSAQLTVAQQRVPALVEQVGTFASNCLIRARREAEAVFPLLLERASSQSKDRARSAKRAMRDALSHATRGITTGSNRAEALVREITGQGPQKTLRRGFAMVRSNSGKTLTTAAEIKSGAHIEVALHDGVVGAVVEVVTQSPDGGNYGSENVS